jgi:predicted N-formylglutamate amidohydrolase
MAEELPRIADAGEPAEVVNAKGQSPIVLVCEHASKYIPNSLGTLGLADRDLISHIAWDPGAEPVARMLSKILDATLVLQRYSRLVYDCNRPPHAASAIPAVSEVTAVPGNDNLSDADRQARIDEIYEPFHATVSDVLKGKQQLGVELVVVSIHSFTPTYKGSERPFELGVLHDQDSRLADAMLLVAAGSTQFECRRNEPYGPQDGVLHTLNLHCQSAGLMNVMLEIRNDVIANVASQELWSNRLGAMMGEALDRVLGKVTNNAAAGSYV